MTHLISHQYSSGNWSPRGAINNELKEFFLNESLPSYPSMMPVYFNSNVYSPGRKHYRAIVDNDFSLFKYSIPHQDEDLFFLMGTLNGHVYLQHDDRLNILYIGSKEGIFIERIHSVILDDSNKVSFKEVLKSLNIYNALREYPFDIFMKISKTLIIETYYSLLK